MASLTVAATIAVFFSVATAGTLSERQAEHQQQLSGLDMSRRAVVPEPERAFLSTGVEDEYRISPSYSPARFSQDRSRVVSLTNRDWWVVWEDARFGSRKILCQRFDSLCQPVGVNEVLAGSASGADFTDPRLALDTLGRIYFAWRDQTGGMIFVRRYAADGSPDWLPFLVNDTSLSSSAGLFDMAVFRDGQVVLVWEDYSALGSTIQMRIFSASGTSLLGPAVVNSDGGTAGHWSPSVAHAPGSGFLVCWEDYRNGQADIYARQFTGAGSPVGVDFAIVPPPDDRAAQYAPRVAYSSKDKYVLGWTDLRAGQEIYLQRFDQTLGLIGDNQLVSSGHALVLNRDPDLSVSISGLTHLVWNASGADNSIQSLMLDSGLVPAGLPDVVNLSALWQRWAPAGAFDKHGNYTVAWTESVDDDPDIALMLFDPSGARRLFGEVTANDDTQGAPCREPDVATTTNWWNVVAFTGERYDQGDIFVRTVSHAGDFPATEVRVNQDVGYSLQSEPDLATSLGRTLVVWSDGRTLGGFSGQRVFGRFLNAYGTPTGNEQMLSDSLSLASKSSPRAVVHPDGVSLAVWLDRRDGAPQVYGNWIDVDQHRSGADFRLSQPAEDLGLVLLCAGVDSLGRTAVVWLDGGLAVPTARGVRYNASHTLTGETIAYAPLNPAIEEMAAAVAPDGSVGLFWTGTTARVRRGYLTVLAYDGSVLAGPDVVTDSDIAFPAKPDLSICNNGYFTLVWQDYRAGYAVVYYRVLDAGRTPLAAAATVTSVAAEFMQDPAVYSTRGRAWFVWSDPRQDGLNIYGGATVYLPTDVGDDPDLLPQGYSLEQNYPNPFNPSTEIKFTIPSAAVVALDVYNALGRKIVSLVDGMRSAGEHRVTWNGCDRTGQRVASGVYFYRLRTGPFSQTKKMVLVK